MQTQSLRLRTTWRACCTVTMTILSGLILALSADAAVIYVDSRANGANNGSDWKNAYPSLATAIKSASPGDEVWVAKGTYDPIELKADVKVFGGFQGHETSASASDPRVRRTYISGGGKSRAIVGVNAGSTTLLRGFIITDGFIDIPDMGGGLFLEDSNVVIADCEFTANRATTLGGAAAIVGGSPAFVNCVFRDNDGGGAAGAVFILGSATPRFTNCLFAKNHAWEAGAVSVLTGKPTFTNCTVADNVATNGQGGAFFDTLGEALLQNCIVWNNQALSKPTPTIYNHWPFPEQPTRVTSSSIQGGWIGYGNASVDPLFVDSEKGDYRLREDSPCKAGGEPGPVLDALARLEPQGSTDPVHSSLKSELAEQLVAGNTPIGAQLPFVP